LLCLRAAEDDHARARGCYSSRPSGMVCFFQQRHDAILIGGEPIGEIDEERARVAIGHCSLHTRNEVYTVPVPTPICNVRDIARNSATCPLAIQRMRRQG